MRTLRYALRLAGRLVVIVAIGSFASVAGIQFARIVVKNVAMAKQFATTQDDVVALRRKQTEQDRKIRRLSDPEGAIPEIHDKLHLVRDHETIIYLEQHGDGR